MKSLVAILAVLSIAAIALALNKGALDGGPIRPDLPVPGKSAEPR